MTKSLVCVAAAACLLGFSCSSSRQAGSATGSEKFASRKLTPKIDGRADEWGDQLSYDDNTKSIYSIANDQSNLYIMVKAADRMQQMKIIQGGMEIWLDSKLKKNKTVGVKYPLGGGQIPMPTGNNNNPPDAKEMRQQMRLQLVTMELKGFRQGMNGSQSVFSDVQVKPVIDWDDKQNLVYELSIPFDALPQEIRHDLSNLSVGFFIKGLKLPDMGSGGFPGGAPGGGMRPPGGGMRPPGGMDMPDRSQMENLTKENSFWTKYTIDK